MRRASAAQLRALLAEAEIAGYERGAGRGNPIVSEPGSNEMHANRRRTRSIAAALLIAGIAPAFAQDDLGTIGAQVAEHHDEAVQRLRDWIALPSIAAENRNYPQGAEYMAQLGARCRLPAGAGDRHRRQTRRVRHARCRRGETVGVYFWRTT